MRARLPIRTAMASGHRDLTMCSRARLCCRSCRTASKWVVDDTAYKRPRKSACRCACSSWARAAPHAAVCHVSTHGQGARGCGCGVTHLLFSEPKLINDFPQRPLRPGNTHLLRLERRERHVSRRVVALVRTATASAIPATCRPTRLPHPRTCSILIAPPLGRHERSVHVHGDSVRRQRSAAGHARKCNVRQVSFETLSAHAAKRCACATPCRSAHSTHGCNGQAPRSSTA